MTMLDIVHIDGFKVSFNLDHVTTIVSRLDIFLSLARDLCSTAQQLVCIRESSIQNSGQTVFIISLKIAMLHHLGSIHHWLFDRISHLLLPLDQSSTEMY